MNTYYFSIIVLVLSLSLIPSFESAFATSESVFFMKANSTAKFYTELTFSKVEGSWTPYPEVFFYPPINDNYADAKSITIKANPNSFAVTQHNVNVTYTIITKNDTKGTFEIFTGSWGYSYPLVVGLNESEVNPKLFYNFQPINCVFCPSFTTEPPSEKVIGYSNLVLKVPYGNSSIPNIQQYPIIPNYPSSIPFSKINGTGNSQQSSAVPEFPFVNLVLLVSIISIIVLYRTKIRR